MNQHPFAHRRIVPLAWALLLACSAPLAAEAPGSFAPSQMVFPPSTAPSSDAPPAWGNLAQPVETVADARVMNTTRVPGSLTEVTPFPPRTESSLKTPTASGGLAQPVEAAADSRDTEATVVQEALADANQFLQNLQLEKLIAHNSLRQWMLALLVASIGLVVGRVTGTTLRWLGRRFDTRGWTIWHQLASGLGGPISLGLVVIGIDAGMLFFLNLDGAETIKGFVHKLRLFFFWLAVIWYIYNLMGIIDVMIHRLTNRTGSSIDQQLAPLVRKTLRSCVVLIGMLSIAKGVFDQDIGAWLTGLGIAGLAVSLAAQDSLKNIFGAVMILIDRPFRLGESIKCCGYEGTIEEIGFRSTKVRTAGGHLVTIPNSSIVNDPIENAARRPYIRRQFNVALAYDVPREKIEQAVLLLRAVLEEPGIREPIHPTIGTSRLAPKVYFTELASERLDLQVTYWYAPPASGDYQEHAQRVNLRILEVLEQAQIELASPTRTLQLTADSSRWFPPERRSA